jgi:hypothetical protein
MDGQIMDDAMLRADCTRCAALCCVAHAFDRSEQFAFDKACGEPCLHLTARFRCGIHGEREQRGFAGCTRYDCFGAGQRVVQDMFGGRTWRDDPALADAMLEAFRLMRNVHELLVLLHAAQVLPLAADQTRERQRLEEALAPSVGWSLESLRGFAKGNLPGDVAEFLSSLKQQAASERASRSPVPAVERGQ